jgi:hypothetical protein
LLHLGPGLGEPPLNPFLLGRTFNQLQRPGRPALVARELTAVGDRAAGADPFVQEDPYSLGLTDVGKALSQDVLHRDAPLHRLGVDDRAELFEVREQIWFIRRKRAPLGER